MEEAKAKNNKLRKLIVFMFMLLITVLVCYAAYFMATKEFETTKEEIFAQESSVLSTWVENTVGAVNLWRDSLNSQAQRVSTSELYRLFATDAATLPEDQARRLNEDATVIESSLSEQIPLMRDVLSDFMNLNGYSDARIINKNGNTLLSAQARPVPIDPLQQEVAVRAIETSSVAFASLLTYSNGVMLNFAAPLKPVLSGSSNDTAIASLLLATPATSNIGRFLTYDIQNNTFNPFILQKKGDQIEIVDINSVTFPVVATALELNDSNNIDFGYRPSVENPDNMVWSYGKFVAGLNWWVVSEIPAYVIQDKLDKEASKIYGFAITFAVGFMLVLALLWWIVIGREQKATAVRFESLYKLIGEQKRILDNVNAALDTGLLAADITGKIIMANRAFGELCSCDYQKVAGESMAPLFDATFTHELLSGIAKASQNGKPFTAEYSALLGKDNRLLRVTFFPFLDNHLEAGESVELEEKAQEGLTKPKATPKAKAKDTDNTSGTQYVNAALITFTDITEFRRQSNAKRNVQEKSMQALVRAVESMDPYLSGHSRRMEQLGVLVCKKLALGENDTNTVAIAANLSQVGKLFVSRDLLLKTGELTSDEKTQLLSIPQKAWLTLKEIDFQLPVPDAVHEMYERLDGKGYPNRLFGDEVGLHARVLSVVNTFCAMIAPRSYRKGLKIDDALTALRCDPGYDQNVVKALEEVLMSSEGLQIAQSVPENVVIS